MPVYRWITPFSDATKSLRSPDPEAEALATWAAWTVDELHYLTDLENLDVSRHLQHSPDVIDHAHARWATMSAATALDLCGAALARHYGFQKGDHELDLNDLRKKTIPQVARVWVDGVWTDADYQLVLKARHSLTHKRLPRNLYVGSANRTELRIRQGHVEIAVTIPDVVRNSTEVATRHVEKFLAEAKAGRF